MALEKIIVNRRKIIYTYLIFSQMESLDLNLEINNRLVLWLQKSRQFLQNPNNLKNYLMKEDKNKYSKRNNHHSLEK